MAGSGALTVDYNDPYVDHVLGRLLQQAAAAGIGPRQVKAYLKVTDLPDPMVEVVRCRAHAAGLVSVILVDDHLPPRPGTRPSSQLPPNATATMDQAAAARRDHCS